MSAGQNIRDPERPPRSVGKKRAGKGACHIDWADVEEWNAGLLAILLSRLSARGLRWAAPAEAEFRQVVDGIYERRGPGFGNAREMRDLADEQQHRRAVLIGDVDADRAVAGAGPARDHRRRPKSI